MKALLAAALIAGLAAPEARAQGARVPVLVELFTSEGCSSCPSADALLESLERDQPVAGARVIAVGLHVDYFNHQGWKDRFSSAAYTARQVEYSRAFGRGPDSVFTPQIVVDGREAVVGSDVEQVTRAIAAAADRAHLSVGVSASVADGRLQLALELPAAPVTSEKIYVVAAITQGGLTTAVTGGENGGRTLRHGSVARTVRRFEALKGAASIAREQMPLDRAWGWDHLEAVVWLQGATSRHVYGAASAPIAK